MYVCMYIPNCTSLSIEQRLTHSFTHPLLHSFTHSLTVSLFLSFISISFSASICQCVCLSQYPICLPLSLLPLFSSLPYYSPSLVVRVRLTPIVYGWRW